MAYNVVKGKVGSIVGKDIDQEVGGKKTFLNPIRANGFYDLQKQSAVATLNDLPIVHLSGSRYNSVITLSGQRSVRAHDSLRFDGKVMKVPVVKADELHGSARGLKDIPSNKFISPVTAGDIRHDQGLTSVNGALQVKAADGVRVTADGVGVHLFHQGGLSLKGPKLMIDPRRTPNVKQGGQNLHDADLVIVQDSSRGDVRHTTLSNLYEGHIKTKVPHPAGGKYNVQFRGNTGFAASPNFCFEPGNNILAVNGQVNTNTLLVLGGVRIEGTTHLSAAVINNVTTVTAETYQVQSGDYTILADTTKNTITIALPPAVNHAGRVINIKKINSNTYRLNTNNLVVKADGGKIDSFTESVFKMNNTSRVFQSDGNTWWIMGSRGS